MYGRWKIRGCVALVLLAAVAMGAMARTPSAFGISAPSHVRLVQGGVVTLPVAIRGSGFTGGTLSLSGPPAAHPSAHARLHGAGRNRIGFAFDNVSAHAASLTLFVGDAVPAGSYPLTIRASAGGRSSVASLALDVLAHGAVHQVWPDRGAAYQSVLSRLHPGDVLELHAGTYPGVAVIDASGTAERPIVIRGSGRGEPKPVLEFAGADRNLWEIHAGNVVVEGLEFRAPATDSIRIRPRAGAAGRAIANVSLIDDVFTDCGSECVTANDPATAYADIRMVDDLVVGARRTPVYIGNQQGLGGFDGFLFEGNVIDGRAIAAADVIGYGIEVKLDVERAELRNNYIVGARGPGVMTYGLQRDRDPALATVVEHNIVIGSCTDPGIDIGAGPAVVRGNLVLGGHGGGFGVSAYHAWPGLSAGIRLHGNTAVLSAPYGFQVASEIRRTGLDDLRMRDNLAYAAPGAVGFGGMPAGAAGNRIARNRTVRPPAALAQRVAELEGRIPAPAALRPFWRRLSPGPLGRTRIAGLLDGLVALPNQSADTAPRACPPAQETTRR